MFDPISIALRHEENLFCQENLSYLDFTLFEKQSMLGQGKLTTFRRTGASSRKARGEGTTQSIMDQKGKMAELAWALKKANYAEETIMMVNSALRTLMARGTNLMDPETVKEVIARQEWSENRRRNVANSYNLYANKYGIK
jgi:hypothetical protein